MVADVQDSLVQVSADGAVWATVMDITTWDAAHGSEGITKRRVFGNPLAHVRLGEDTDTYDIGGLLNLADADGQNLLRDARDNRTTVFLRVLPAGDTVGAEGYSQECYVTEYGDSGDADGGDYVECSFSLEGAGAKLPVTISV